ncbi:MAG: 2-hydroxychromene-2-carboxylate isomerase [Alphaproteobacteria bacterium]
MSEQANGGAEIKMYSDYKSPYAYLAFDPAFELPQRYRVRLRWMPFQLRLKGKGQRSQYSEYKVKYSYMDARRWAKPRGLWIRGPLKIYDTTPALIGGLFAERQGRLVDYSRTVFKQFFLRELEVDQPDAIAKVIAGLGLSESEYRDYLAGEGQSAYDRAQEESVTDRIFGVPIFVLDGELFWGYDRMAFLEERLEEKGLALG